MNNQFWGLNHNYSNTEPNTQSTIYNYLSNEIRRLWVNNHKNAIIICGPSGSGKTFLIKKYQEEVLNSERLKYIDLTILTNNLSKYNISNLTSLINDQSKNIHQSIIILDHFFNFSQLQNIVQLSNEINKKFIILTNDIHKPWQTNNTYSLELRRPKLHELLYLKKKIITRITYPVKTYNEVNLWTYVNGF